MFCTLSRDAVNLQSAVSSTISCTSVPPSTAKCLLFSLPSQHSTGVCTPSLAAISLKPPTFAHRKIRQEVSLCSLSMSSNLFCLLHLGVGRLETQLPTVLHNVWPLSSNGRSLQSHYCVTSCGRCQQRVYIVTIF
jgi:hypothetical protein